MDSEGEKTVKCRSFHYDTKRFLGCVSQRKAMIDWGPFSSVISAKTTWTNSDNN